ncbi:MAG: hypothetical protein Q9160_002118 [Pyrenula sp. 1 TL-2023]
MANTDDKSKSYFPLASGATDGYSNDHEATASCFCGAVQLAFPTSPPGLVDAFICNCADCHKITASMFASNFTVVDTHLRHLRGQSLLSTYTSAKTTASGNAMTNYFCSTCGTLLYRVSSGLPGHSILRIGTIDDFRLQEGKVRPRREQFVKERFGWLRGLDGVEGTVAGTEGNGKYGREGKSVI